MLMQRPTPEMNRHWKSVWNEYKDRLCPNRKSGAELVEYVIKKYPLKQLHNPKAVQVVTENVLQNEPFAEKLSKEKQPPPVAFIVENTGEGKKLYEEQDEVFVGNEIFVGIDLESGFYYVECSSLLWDELCAFQGLDEVDIQNIFYVAQYIFALERFELLESVL